MSYYPFKINIGIGGFNGSGKSTLINTILEEKRCSEEKGYNNNNDSVYEYNLKEFGLNFIEFPGFNSKLDNTEQIINKIKLKILEMSKNKEKLHCFLFCINYEENLSEENQLINKIFESLFEINTRIFFIITQSEKPDSEGFKQIKGKILNILGKAKNNYSKEVIDIILGQHIENAIIPIISTNKKLGEKTLKPFGIDILFIHLFDYFSLKIIKNNNIYEDEYNDKDIQKLINEHFLLKIFNSKNDLLESLKLKMEKYASNFFYKVLILNPNYLNNFSKDIIYKLYDNIYNQFIINYKYIIDKLKEEEKLRFYNISKLSRVNKDEIDKIFNSPEFDKIKSGLIENKELINSPHLNLLSKKISDLIIEQFYRIIKDNKYFPDFFKDIINSFNMTIAALYVISDYYREFYLKNEKENEKGKNN
jgi:GTP-binding protein EngB required for normal cell division